MFRKFRILLLLLVLATVALSAWRANARLTSWEHSVHIAHYPVAADDSPTTARYVAQLGADDFAEIGEWLRPTDSAAGKRHAVHAPSFTLGLLVGRYSSFRYGVWSMYQPWPAASVSRVIWAFAPVPVAWPTEEPERSAKLRVWLAAVSKVPS